MKRMLPLTLALFNVFQSFPRTTSFLESLEAVEKPSYINVIKLDESVLYPELFDVLKQPKIILDANSLNLNVTKSNGFDYLNLPRYENKNLGNIKISTLKLQFNSEILTIIVTDKISKIPINFINRFLIFSKLETVLIISANEDFQSLNKTMHNFYRMRFTNIIHLDVVDFENNQMLTSFESFPNFNLVTRPNFKKETVTNIMLKEVPINFHRMWPFVLIGKTDDEIGGISFHILKTFVKYINGTFIYKAHRSMDTQLIHSDVYYSLPFLPLDQYKALYPYSSEVVSNVLDTSDYIIIMPKAKPTLKKLYLVRIFSKEILIFTLVFVFFGSVMFSIYEKSTEKEVTFWRIFGHLFRSSLAQSFPWSTTFNLTSMFYFIPIWFGFILTLWFNAILGSFVTTTLYDKQAITFDDMRMMNIKFASYRDLSYAEKERFKEIPENLFVELSAQDHYLLHFIPNEYAVAVYSHFWKYVMVPFMTFYKNTFFVLSDHVLETSVYRILLQPNCPFKETLNRFIDLIKDVGLYKHWCDSFFIDGLKDKFHGHHHYVKRDSIQVLQIDFFTYPMLILIVGLTLAGSAFLFEIDPPIILYLKKRLRKLYFLKNRLAASLR